MLTVINNTDKPAIVYEDPACSKASPDDPVLPGTQQTITGASVILK
jgi:hypothetical protein